MLPPKDTIDLQELKAQQKMLRRRYTVGVVNPTGAVMEVVCAPDGNGINSLGAGRDVVRLNEGEIRLTAYGRNAGWTLLEQRCIEDGCPERYQAWLETVHARMDGHAIEFPRVNPKDMDSEFDMSAILPPSVVEQRKSGPKGLKPKRYVPGRGLVDAEDNPETPKERKARVGRRAREMGLAPTEE